MNVCPGQIQACAMRVARLEPNGVPDPGANNLIVTNSLVTFTLTVVYADGEEFEVKNGCGDVCLTFKDCDRLKRIDFTLDVCQLDPELTELLAGGTVLTSGQAVGYKAPLIGDGCPNPNGVSVELWARRVIDGAIDPDFPYEWWVFPRLFPRITERTFQNGPMSHPFSGFGNENPNWFDGPLNDWPVDSDGLWQHLPTDSIPTASCGYGVLQAS